MQRYVCERQDGNKDCGVCSLLTIVKTYHGEVSKEYLRMITKTGKNGVNAYFLAEAGKLLGFTVMGVEGDFRDLKKEQLPCIAHIMVNQSYYHFVVIHEINHEKEYLVVADPAIGIRTISFSEFDRLKTGKYLLFSLSKPLLLHHEKYHLKKDIFRFFTSFQGLIFLILILSFGFVMTELFLSFSFQMFLKDAILSYSNLFRFSLLFLVVLLFSELFQYFRKRLTLWLCKENNVFLFRLLFAHLFSLPYFYFKSRTTGEVLSRISDLNQLQDGIGQFFFSFLMDLFSFLFLFVVLFFMTPSFGVYLLLLFSLLGVLVFLRHFRFRRYLDEYHLEGGSYTSILNEAIQGMSTIQNLQLSLSIQNTLCRHYTSFLKKKEKVQKFLLEEGFLFAFMKQGGLFLLLFLGGVQVLEGKLTLDQVFSFYMLSQFIMSSFYNILLFYEQYQGLIVIIRRLEELLACPKEKIDLDIKYSKEKWKRGISIQHLSYSYLPDRFLFRDYSLEIEKGEKILLFGESGSGKSTLAKLILRYLDVASKMIYLNGKDVTDYSLLSLRESISYLSQDELLFTDTVYQNVVFHRDYSYDEFLTIARLVKLDFVKEKSSLGYDYMLEEDGFNLSGGERQRVLLARTLLKKAELYILDESFSQIDIKMEREILKEVFAYYPDKTFLVISHRLSNQDLYHKKIRFRKEKN